MATAEEFREEQQQKARDQGATAENAVPEQRPIASQTVEGGDSEITQRLREAGELQDEPMPKSAFDRAESDTQAKRAEKASRTEAIHVGDAVRVKDKKSPHYGRRAAVVRAVYAEDDYGKRSGQPEQRFMEAQELELSTRGDERDNETLLLKPSQLERITTAQLTGVRGA